MHKIESVIPYLLKEPEYHLDRSCENLNTLIDRILELNEIRKGNTIFNIAATAVSRWSIFFHPFYHGLLDFQYNVTSINEFEFHYVTNLPEIENERFFSMNLSVGEVEGYSKLKLFSHSDVSVLADWCGQLYDDSFCYFLYIPIWIVGMIHDSDSIEIYSKLEVNETIFRFYNVKDKNYIELKIDIAKLDLVRDRWYQFILENGFMIKESNNG